MNRIYLPGLACGLLLSTTLFSSAALIEFDISPPGTTPALALSPDNEVIPGSSSGSGNEIGTGIRFDTISMLLSFSIGYGSSAGFTDLTGPAFAFLLHGPASPTETAPVLFDLSPFHTFASDPTEGGTIIGSLTLSSQAASSLLQGLDYINIYTPANLGGEIRGQLVAVNTSVPDSGPGMLLLTASLFGGLLALHRRYALAF